MVANHGGDDATPVPAYDETVRCSEHPAYRSVLSYGLAGGSCGLYTLCCLCGKILTKEADYDGGLHDNLSTGN
jgi:hypothetical protein